MKSGDPVGATWRRLRSSRAALLVVVVVAAVFSVATSEGDVRIEGEGASGTFVLSSDEPTASVFYRVEASDAVSGAEGRGAFFTFSVATLDPEVRSTVGVYLNGTAVELSELRLTVGCDQCFEGGDSYTFQFEGGVAPAIVHWSVYPLVTFEGDEAPKDVVLELEASSTGEVTPATWFDGGTTTGGGWQRNVLSVMTRTPIESDTEAWLVFSGGRDPILVGPSPDRVPVTPGGAVAVPIPVACLIGPCIIEAETVMNHGGYWSLALVGDAEVAAPAVVDRQVGWLMTSSIEHAIDVGPGQSVTFDLHVTSQGFDPALVAVVPPRAFVDQHDQGDGSERTGYLRCEPGCTGQTMSCDGPVCSRTFVVTFTAYDDASVQDTLVLRAGLVYDQEVVVELEIVPR